MLRIARILHLVLIKKFYERHAGLLFFVFYVMFGMVESGQLVSYHLGLIYGAIGAPVFLLLVLFLWFLYIIKSVLFFLECFAKPQNAFLREFKLLGLRSQFFWIIYTLLLAYLPVFLYSLVILGVAFQIHAFLPLISIIVFHVMAISLGAWIIVQRNNSSSPPLLVIPTFHWPWPKPLPFFYLGLLIDRFKIALLLTKLFSVFAIIGLLQIPLDHYEPRLALMGLATGLAAHTVIIFELRKFEDHYLFFTKGLPIDKKIRFGILAIVYSVILLPELVLLILQRQNLTDLLTALIFGISFLLLSHSSLYKSGLDNERHMQNILWFFLAAFFLVLCKAALPVGVLVFLLSFYRFQKHYYLYEASANISG